MRPDTAEKNVYKCCTEVIKGSRKIPESNNTNVGDFESQQREKNVIAEKFHCNIPPFSNTYNEVGIGIVTPGRGFKNGLFGAFFLQKRQNFPKI